MDEAGETGDLVQNWVSVGEPGTSVPGGSSPFGD
jgi:hypothetical protein